MLKLALSDAEEQLKTTETSNETFKENIETVKTAIEN
jgi:hypothetical protein